MVMMGKPVGLCMRLDYSDSRFCVPVSVDDVTSADKELNRSRGLVVLKKYFWVRVQGNI